MKVKKSPAKLQRDKIRLLKKKLQYEMAKQETTKAQRQTGQAASKERPTQEGQESKKKEGQETKKGQESKSSKKDILSKTANKPAAFKQEDVPMEPAEQQEDPTGDEDSSSSESLI